MGYYRLKAKKKLYSIKSIFFDKYVTNVNSICAFVSFMRSGHTLFGSLLNAHPEMTVSNEIGIGHLMRMGFSEREILRMIIGKDYEFRQSGREWTGYDYEVEGGSQGNYQDLVVVGDKHGPDLIYNYLEDESVYKYIKKSKKNYFIFYHIRNPYDMIATGTIKGDKKLNKISEYVCNEIERSVKVVGDLRNINNVRVLKTYYKNIVNDTKGVLVDVMDVMGLSAPKSYLEACADHVFEQPSITRDEVDWDADSVDLVEKTCNEFDSFARYAGTL